MIELDSRKKVSSLEIKLVLRVVFLVGFPRAIRIEEPMGLISVGPFGL